MSTAERVARGAAFLDEVRPGWYRAIKPIDLDLHDNRNCVIGQVYGDFMVFMTRRYYPGLAFAPDRFSTKDAYIFAKGTAWSCRYGFQFVRPKMRAKAELLWLEAIAVRVEAEAEIRALRAAEAIRLRAKQFEEMVA